MVQNNAYRQYRENSIFTSTPEELTFALYNGLIRFIMQAKLAINEKNFEKAHNSITRSEEIIMYLIETLDMKFDISKDLDRIYQYMNGRLIEANIKKDTALLDEVLDFARVLRDTWSQAMKLAKHDVKPELITNQA